MKFGLLYIKIICLYFKEFQARLRTSLQFMGRIGSYYSAEFKRTRMGRCLENAM